MDFVNVDGKRLLVGVGNDKILTLDNFHDINEPTDFNETNTNNVLNPSIVVHNNESYIGLGAEGADKPKFVGKVLNTNVSGTSSDSVIVEDAENKPLNISYYKINKVATTIPLNDNFGCTKSEEIKYVWGVGNNNKFLYKITVDESATEGTVEVSNIIKDSDGLNIDTNIVSISTCISQNNMLWATGKNGNIYRLHVNASTNNITIESKITPFFTKTTHVDAETFNKYNKKHPENASISDIIEVKDKNSNKHELIISYYKEEGFDARESYIFSRTLSSWDSTDTVDQDFSLSNINDLLDDNELITRVYLSNFLFKDISVIFDDVTFNETDGGNEFGIHTVATRISSKNANNALRNLINAQGLSGYQSYIYKTNDSYIKRDDGTYRYNDWDIIPNDPNDNNALLVLTGNDNYEILSAVGNQTTDESVYRIDLGKNLGFQKGFKLFVSKFGLISTNKSNNQDSFNNYVQLYCVSNKPYIKSGGSIKGLTVGNSSYWFGSEDYEEQEFTNGFFISIAANKKDRPFYPNQVANFTLEEHEQEESPKIYSYLSSLPCLGVHGQGSTSRIGHANLHHLSTDSPNNGGFFDDISPLEGESTLLYESFVLDRFNDRETLTTETYNEAAVNENFGFFSLSSRSSGSDDIDKVVVYTMNFDTVNFLGGDSETGIDKLFSSKRTVSAFNLPESINNFGGACLFPIFNTGVNFGGHGSNDYRLWMFSLHSAGSNNYRNGYKAMIPTSSSTVFNEFDNTIGSSGFQSLITEYSSLSFTEHATSGNDRFDQNDKIFYRIAVVFENGSVSKLSNQEFEHTVATSGGIDALEISITINKEDVSPRAVGLQLYRRIGDAETQYQLALNDLSLLSGWSSIDNTNFIQKIVFDKGEEIGLYQDISGLSLNIVTQTTLPKYELSTIVNNKHIIGSCFTNELKNMPNRLFASLPGRYNSFKIDDELNSLLLPSKPTAIKGFNGRLFAFEENKMFIINTDAMIIEDQLEGIGCLSQESVVVTEFGMFTANNSNIYHYTGENTIPIASSILKSNNNIGWLEREPTFDPLVAFNSKRDSLIVVFRQKNILSDDEINAIVEEILESGNPDNLSVLDIIEGLSPYFAWVYNLRLKRWDLWELPSKTPKAIVADKNGDIIISTDQGLFKYATDEDNKRKWGWVSKQITLGEDNKSKKYYKIKTHSNTDEEFLQYSVDKGEFVEGLNINKKAKSLQVKIDSEDPNLEVDSISIPYRNLPNSKQNI